MSEKKAYYKQQYALISSMLKLVNPCEVSVTDGVVSCIGLREGDRDADPQTLCCTECRHLADKGCTVESLGCRMWLCNAAIGNLFRKYAEKPDMTVKLIKEIQETNRTCAFFDISFRSRHSMEENLAAIVNRDAFKESKATIADSDIIGSEYVKC